MPKATAEKPLGYTVTPKQQNVFDVSVPYAETKSWEKWFLLSGDRQFDNPHSNLPLQQAHLREAAARGAGVIDIGDFYCLMQGRYDNRSSKSDIRPEHNNSRYLDSVISTSVDFFKPWARQFIMIGTGNHESSVNKRCETDMVQRFCDALNHSAKSNVYSGGFSGWVRFRFRRNGKNDGTHTVNLHYDHGWGGGGPVTRGVIQTNRRAVSIPDANIFVSGHIHEAWIVETPRLRLNGAGKTHHDRQTHICVPTYKEEYGDGHGGWHVERGAPPKMIGAVWLRFFWNHREHKVCWEATLAQ